MKKVYKLVIVFLIIALVFTTIGVVAKHYSWGMGPVSSGYASSDAPGGRIQIYVQKPAAPAGG